MFKPNHHLPENIAEGLKSQFLQILGVDMGTKCATMYANLFMNHFEGTIENAQVIETQAFRYTN